MKIQDALEAFKKYYGKPMCIAHPDLEDGWNQVAFFDIKELEADALEFYNDPTNKDVELDSYNTPFFTILTEGFFVGSEEADIAEGKLAFVGVLGACGDFWTKEGLGSPMQNKALFLKMKNDDQSNISLVVYSPLSVDLEREEEKKYQDDDDYNWDGPRVVVSHFTDLKLWIRGEDEDEPDLSSINFEKLSL